MLYKNKQCLPSFHLVPLNYFTVVSIIVTWHFLAVAATSSLLLYLLPDVLGWNKDTEILCSIQSFIQ